MTVFITKYVLTQGIWKAEAEVCSSICETMIEVRNKKNPSFPYIFHKPYWHSTLEEAIVHANKIRAAKLKSLDKSRAKIEKLNFSEDLKEL